MQTQAKSRQLPLVTPRIPAGQEGRVESVLEAVQKHLGFVPDGIRLFSFSPPLLENFVGMISYFNSGERLSPALMTMIRYLVSNNAQCLFCIDMNEGFLTHMGFDIDTLRAARKDPDLAPLPANEKVLLKLALQSVTHPEEIGTKDIEKAKDAGWSERDIFDVVAQAASNRALNYILRTFKVESQGAFA